MLVLELRWVFFGLVVGVLAAGALLAWLDRQRRRWRDAMLTDVEGGRAALERAPIGLLMLDGSSAFRNANARARHLLGLTASAGALPEATWVSLLQEDRAAARQALPAAERCRSVLLSPDRAIRWEVIPWGNLDVVFLLDVTLEQRAEQAAGSLLTDLSHELRTPLATILTHVEILLLPDISAEIGQQSLHLLKAESQRMARLVNDILELGRLETSTETKRWPVDIVAVAKGAVTQMTSQAQERGIAITLETDALLPLVVGSEDRLRQVFLNLLDNAVKFCRPGDRVEVSLRRQMAGIACAVCDSGPGIPAKHLPHVTRRFYRGVLQAGEGSGLGLALVAEILRRHDSRLEIESQAEGDETGTCVRFVLPVPPEEAER